MAIALVRVYGQVMLRNPDNDKTQANFTPDELIEMSFRSWLDKETGESLASLVLAGLEYNGYRVEKVVPDCDECGHPLCQHRTLEAGLCARCSCTNEHGPEHWEGK